jgi:hypothetical protein
MAFAFWHRFCGRVEIMYVDISRINHAVSLCLNHCSGNDDRIARLAGFCEGLRAAGWTESEIRMVDVTVIRMLRGIVREGHDDACQV